MEPVDPEEFLAIIEELRRKPLEINRYRPSVGEGRSQCFGIVSKRSACPDLSRQSWKRVGLHQLLMSYAKKFVSIPFTSIQVNQNMTCAEHLDKGNIGMSYIIAFGDYEGGALTVEGVSHDIKYKPFLFDGSKQKHKTENFTGNRYSLVYHTINPRPSYRDIMPSLDNYKIVVDGDILKIKDTRRNLLLWGSNGLPHPLQKKKNL